MTATLYAGRTCNLLELSSQHIRDLYPRPEVVSVLAEYRPWYRPLEHTIDNLVTRSEWLASLSPRPELEALIVAAPNETPVGFICLGGLDSANLKAEFSIGMFHREGTRVPLEALHWVLETTFAKLHKVVFCVSPTNKRAVRLIESLDIPFEARLREEVLDPRGNRQDLLRYALLAPEWRVGSTRKLLQRLAPLNTTPVHTPS